MKTKHFVIIIYVLSKFLDGYIDNKGEFGEKCFVFDKIGLSERMYNQ